MPMTQTSSKNIFNVLSIYLFAALVAAPPLFFGARGEYIPYLGFLFAPVALATAARPLKEKTFAPSGWIFILAMATLSIASQIFSVYPRDGREMLIVLLIYAWIYWHSSETRDLKAQEKIILALALAGAFVAAYGLYSHFAGTNVVWGRPAHEVYAGRLTGTYMNPNHAACLLVIAIPAAGYFCASGAPWRRAAGAAAILIMSAALAFTFSRGGMLSAAAVAIFASLTFIFKSGKFSPAIKACAVIVVLSIFIIGCFKVMSLRRDPKAHDLNVTEVWRPGAGDDSIEARYALAKDTLKMISERPATGSGPGTYKHIYPKYRSHGITLLANAAHNDYLQNASEFGVLFGALFICFIVFVLFSGFIGGATNIEFLKSPAFFMMASAVGFCAFMPVDFNFRVPANGIIFFFALGAASKPGNSFRTGKAANAVGRVALTAAVILIVFLSYETFTAAAYFSKAEDNAVELTTKIQFAEKALELDPQNYDYALGAAELSLKKNVAEKSRSGINESIDYALTVAPLNEFDGRAYSVAAKGATILREYERAEEYVRKGLAIEPLNAGFMDLLVLVLMSRGEKEEALKWVEKSCAELPDRNNHYFIREGRWDRDVYAAAARGFETVWKESRDYEAIRALMALSRQALKAKDCELPLLIRDKYQEQILPSLVQWTDKACGNRD